MKFLDELAARRRFGMKPGLDTMRGICAALGNPEQKFRAVHIAGTNGKGAVCAIIDSCLRAAGMHVGRYTSPHLVSLNERFFLDGRPVSDAALEDAFSAVAAVAPDGLTFFEALTAAAFRIYADAAVDVAVLETGLGGRLDATNVCNPCLTVITRIGLDHCDWLGDTIEKIAAEKAGIIKPGVPVVLGANEESVREVVRRRASDARAPFFYAPDIVSCARIPESYALAGAFNRENAVTALAALKILADGGDKRASALADNATLAKGFASVVWPGRFHRVGNFIIDGAHNPPAAHALADALKDEPPMTLVAGFCGDKDVDEVLRILSPRIRRGLAVRTNNPRSLSAEETAAKMKAVGIEAEPCSSLREAIRRIGNDEPALICGSLFLAGEALTELNAFPYSSSRFDPSEQLSSSADNGTI